MSHVLDLAPSKSLHQSSDIDQILYPKNTSERATPSDAFSDFLDLQDIWHITTDMVNAAQSASTSVSAIACTLAEDFRSSSSAIRQQLLEIRAQLVYLLSDVIYSIISHTSTLAASGAIIMSDSLHRGPREGILTALEPQWTKVLNACVVNRDRVDEFLGSWQAVHRNILTHHSADAQPLRRPFATFFRALGTFGPEPAPLTAPPECSSIADAVSNVRRSMESLKQCLTLVEAFWRKRQTLFSLPGEVFTHEQLAIGSTTWAKLGDSYPSFSQPLYNCVDNLSLPPPCITKSPDDLPLSIRSKLAWRALLVA